MEIRRKVNGCSISITYGWLLAHVCQNRPFSCAKSCAILLNAAKWLTIWVSIRYVASVSCANIFGTRGLSLPARIRLPEYKSSRDVFENFCRVKREIRSGYQWLKIHRFEWVDISIANDRTEPVSIPPFLLTRTGLFPVFFYQLADISEGECAP